MIYIKPLTATKHGKITVYGMYGETNDDGYDIIANNVPVNEEFITYINRDYHHIQAIEYPYDNTPSDFSFKFSNYSTKFISAAHLNLQYKMYNHKILVDSANKKISLQNVDSRIIIFYRNNYEFINKSTELDYTDFYKEVGFSLCLYYDLESKEVNIKYINEYNLNLLWTTRVVILAILYFSASGKIYNVLNTDELYINGKKSSDITNVTDQITTVSNNLAPIKKWAPEQFKFLRNYICRIFQKVVCVGDSYTSGHICDANGVATPTNENYSWVHYMSQITGSKWINCGCSGCNVITWQTHTRGLPTAKSTGKAQAYVIGLMINDQSESTRGIPLGTSADIGTDAQTYYGGLSAIIRKLNEISPKAKIFVNTCPKKSSKFTLYNEAVRTVVKQYVDTYPVHCIDLDKYSYLYDDEVLNSDAWYGHYTAIGYEIFAEIYNYILSKYISENIKKFQDVYQIEYDS